MRITLESCAYDVNIGQQNLYKISDYAKGRRVYIVTDKNVEALHFYRLKEALGYTPDYFVLPAGEKSKSWKSVEKIIKDLMGKGHNRSTLLIAFGGGVVGDIAGFTASVFMRGVDFLQVPTTLLAAVDSSTGGKTGINFGGYKNYVGAFKQPVGVVIDTSLFGTLPQSQILSGAGEIIKTALLDADIFKYFSEYKNYILALEWPYIEEIVKMCVFLKGGIVMKDEKEKGVRKVLNAGHTVGHALESLDKFRRSHGEYVLSGIYYECNIADRAGIIDKEYKKAVQELVKSVMPDLVPLRPDLTAAMKMDKKNDGNGITFILPVNKGKVQEVRLKEDDLRTSL